MDNILGNMGWVEELIPDLSSRLDQFVVDTAELDDELAEIFVEEIQRLTGTLQKGLAQRDVKVIRNAAHSIKGMGGAIGLPGISVLGLDIENLAKADRLMDTQPLIDGLSNWLSTLC